MNSVTWTEREIDIVRALWTSGVSASKIAEQLTGPVERSRCAVIGVVHRLGLNRQGRINAAPAPSMKKKKPQAFEKRVTIKPKTILATHAAQKAKIAPESFIALFDAQDHHCRYPYGEPRDLVCCGMPITLGSYCADHAAICYTQVRHA